jgi:hypothetical protein
VHVFTQPGSFPDVAAFLNDVRWHHLNYVRSSLNSRHTEIVPEENAQIRAY